MNSNVVFMSFVYLLLPSPTDVLEYWMVAALKIRSNVHLSFYISVFANQKSKAGHIWHLGGLTCDHLRLLISAMLCVG